MLKIWKRISLALCLFCMGCQSSLGIGQQPVRQESPAEVLYATPMGHEALTGAEANAPQAIQEHSVPSPSLPPAASPSPSAASAEKQEPSAASLPAVTAPPAIPPVKKKPAAKQAAKGSKGVARKSGGTGAKSKGSSSLSELRVKYADSFIFSGSASKMQVALTFDDAPDTLYTPRVLDILRKNGVKATFFLVGNRAEKHPDMVRRIVREGHVIGNHSYGHALLKKLEWGQFVQEIERAEKVLAPLAGYKPRLVRPPYGAVNDAELAWLKTQGYVTVNWNVDPQDWKGVSGSEVLKRSLDAASPGAIILMHSATGQGGSLQGTVDALPGMIEALQAKGYKLVTLPELLGTNKAK